MLLDLGRCAYINSSGIALVVGLLALCRADGRRLSARGVSAHYRRLFDITRISDHLHVLPEGERGEDRMNELVELSVRHPQPSVAVVEVSGELTAASGDALASAYTRADKPGVHGIVLDFTGLDYMNSGGLGVLVTLLVRANRHQQRVVAHGWPTTTGRS